jgi:hypothetical protein
MSEALSYSIGNQTMKFGGSFSHVGFNNSGPAAGAFGSFTWPTLEAFLTDQNLSSLQSEVPNADTARTVRQNIYGFYFQDDWRMRSNLTLNLGIRYEPWTSPTEKWGRVSTIKDWPTATQFSHPSTDGTDSYFDSPGETTFSPRVGVAWDVNGDGKTAVRAGAGIFHIMLLSPYLNTVTRKNPPNAGTLVQSNPGVNFAGADEYVGSRELTIRSVNLTPTTFSEAIQFDLDPMYEFKFNASVEREVMRDLSVSLGYVGSRGNHLTVKSDWNAIFPTLVNGRAFVDASFGRPNPRNGVITGTTSDGKSFYNALSIEVKKRLSAGFQVQTVYTWSKNVDDSSTGLGNSDFGEGLITQPYNHRADRGPASTNIGQNFVVNGLWELPSPTGSALARGFLGGWRISGILRAASGVPVGPTLSASGNGSAPDLRRTPSEEHPELMPGRDVASMTSGTFQGCAATAGVSGYEPGQKLGTPDLYFDPCAFTRPEFTYRTTQGAIVTVPAGSNAALPSGATVISGFYGNVGRNIIVGPGFLNADLSLMKAFPVGLGEGVRLQFQADLFNIANHPNFGRPTGRTTTLTTGKVSTNAGKITSASAERQMQFGLKLVF